MSRSLRLQPVIHRGIYLGDPHSLARQAPHIPYHLLGRLDELSGLFSFLFLNIGSLQPWAQSNPAALASQLLGLEALATMPVRFSFGCSNDVFTGFLAVVHVMPSGRRH